MPPAAMSQRLGAFDNASSSPFRNDHAHPVAGPFRGDAVGWRVSRRHPGALESHLPAELTKTREAALPVVDGVSHRGFGGGPPLQPVEQQVQWQAPAEFGKHQRFGSAGGPHIAIRIRDFEPVQRSMQAGLPLSERTPKVDLQPFAELSPGEAGRPRLPTVNDANLAPD